MCKICGKNGAETHFMSAGHITRASVATALDYLAGPVFGGRGLLYNGVHGPLNKESLIQFWGELMSNGAEFERRA